MSAGTGTPGERVARDPGQPKDHDVSHVRPRHVAEDIAVEFLALLDVSSHAARPFTDLEFFRLAALVAGSDDVMPAVACDLLDVPRGSTYADGVSSRASKKPIIASSSSTGPPVTS